MCLLQMLDKICGHVSAGVVLSAFFCLVGASCLQYLPTCLLGSLHAGAADKQECRSAFADVCTRTHCSRMPQMLFFVFVVFLLLDVFLQMFK